jgi:hypothetical protein
MTSFGSRMRSLAIVVATITWPALAMADSALPGQAEPHGSVVQAVIVFLCVTLGLILVNRSANRRSELLIDEIDDE